MWRNKQKKFVKDQTEDICKDAVQQNGTALKYVEEQEQTKDICKIAVQQNGLAQEFVKEQEQEQTE